MAESKQRVMVTLTAQQVEQMDRVTEATAVSRSSIISLALSEWLARWERTHGEGAETWGAGCRVYQPDPLSGEPTSWTEGWDTFPTREEAMAHARRLCEANDADGIPCAPYVVQES